MRNLSIFAGHIRRKFCFYAIDKIETDFNFGFFRHL
jgi:hypothetical protein